MKKFKKSLALLFIFFSTQFSWSLNYSDFQHILIDVRADRGGKGDIAAGYLAYVELSAQYLKNSNTRITVLATEEGFETFSTLLGKKIKGSYLSDNPRYQIFTDKNFKQSHAHEIPADLVLQLARVNGYQTRSEEFSEDDDSLVKVTPDAVTATLSVYGNSENLSFLFKARRYTHPASLIKYKGSRIEVASAGLGELELGLYRDISASKLRGVNRQRIKADLIKLLESKLAGVNELASSIQETSLNRLLEILKNNSDKNVDFAFAYGVQSHDRIDQFSHYVEQVNMRSSKRKQVSIIFNPGTNPDLNEENMPKNLVHVKSTDLLPESLRSANTYLIEVPEIPNEVFNYLLALSYYPPVVAGDGGLSAVVELGIPFFMVFVPWNMNNLVELENTLKDLEKAAGKSKFYSSFDFSLSAKLERFNYYSRAQRLAFEKLHLKNGKLLEQVISRISLVKRLEDTPQDYYDVIMELRNPIEVVSFFQRAIALGARGAKKAYYDYVRQLMNLETDYKQDGMNYWRRSKDLVSINKFSGSAKQLLNHMLEDKWYTVLVQAYDKMGTDLKIEVLRSLILSFRNPDKGTGKNGFAKNLPILIQKSGYKKIDNYVQNRIGYFFKALFIYAAMDPAIDRALLKEFYTTSVKVGEDVNFTQDVYRKWSGRRTKACEDAMLKMTTGYGEQ